MNIRNTYHSTASFNKHVVIVNSPWRKLPQLLEVMRDVPVDIRRAYIQKETSTLFINAGSPLMTPEDLRIHMERIENGTVVTAPSSSQNPRVELPIDAQIMIYNIPNIPYTTMEFHCKDRIGLLSDVLQYMSGLDVDIHDAHITTMSDQAHNIFHLQKSNKPLDFHQIMYIRNVFEHDVKPRFKDCNDLL